MQSENTTSPPSPSSLTFEQKALQLLERGFFPIPLCWPNADHTCGCGRGHIGRNIGKAPLLGKRYQATLPTEEIIKEWGRSWPWANVGILLKPSGLIFVGGDSPEARSEVLRRGQPPSVFRVSANTGLLYRRPVACRCGSRRVEVADSHIDVKANGFAVAWGRHRDGCEVYLEGEDLTEAPAWTVEVLSTSKPESNGQHPTTEPVTDHDIALAARSIGLLSTARRDSYHDWVSVGMALHHLGDVGLALWERWSRPSPKYQSGDCIGKWDSFDDEPDGDASVITLGSLFHWAKVDSGHDVTLNPVIRVSGPDHNIEAPVTKERFPLHQADEALLPIIPLEEIVAGLTTRSTLCALCGDAGSGKTWFALAKALCIAAGIPFLGREVKQGPVLIIDEESGHRRLHIRLQSLMRGYGVLHAGIPLYWSTYGGFSLLNPTDIVAMHAVIAKLEPIYTVVDALMEVVPGADENSSELMGPALRTLLGWTREFDLASDLIHHHNKRGGYRGTSAIKGVVDQMLNITKERNQPLLKIESEKNRDGEDIRIATTLEIIDLPQRTVRLQLADAKPAQPRLTPGETWVMAYVVSHAETTLDEIREAGRERYSDHTTKKYVWDLVDRGLIRRVDAGGNGTTARFQAVY